MIETISGVVTALIPTFLGGWIEKRKKKKEMIKSPDGDFYHPSDIDYVSIRYAGGSVKPFGRDFIDVKDQVGLDFLEALKKAGVREKR